MTILLDTDPVEDIYMPTMDPTLKERWVTALRSGEYQQGQGVLRTTDDHFCCLGVLCDLIDRDAWSQGDDLTEPWDHRGAYGFPTQDMLNQVGLDLGLAHHLATLNDEGANFATIAGAIEAHA